MAVPGRDDVEAAPDSLLDSAYCTKTEDFFSAASRDLIGRFLSAFLESWILTPTELVHSARSLRRLNDSGRPLMNALDKIATLQVRNSKENAGKRLADLSGLVDVAMKMVWDDERERPIHPITLETYTAFVDGVWATGFDRDYLINLTLAEFLSQFKVWADKLAVLVRLHDLSRSHDGNPYVVAIIAECLKSDGALDQMFGLFEIPEERCIDLTALWKGEWKPHATSHPVLETINGMVASGGHPNLRPAIETALLLVLSGKEPLRSAEPEVEVQAVFDTFKRLWIGGTNLIGGAKAMTALERRQARILSSEGVTDILRERTVLVDRYTALMHLSTITIGQGNRATLKTFMAHYFNHRDFVARVIAGDEPPIPKLQSLTMIHRTIKSSWLSDRDKGSFMAPVEAAQGQLMANAKLFESLDKRGGTASQKVLSLLDLCRKGTFIEGPNLAAARKVIEGYLADPGFLPDYLGGARGEEKDRKMALLSKALGSYGITV